MFSSRISLISLYLSLLLSSFVNCYVYMIVRSSLKTIVYMKYIVYILLFFLFGLQHRHTNI